MVWVVEWTQPGQSEVNITCWATEGLALMAACSDILNVIRDDWDLSDPDIKAKAVEINDFVSTGSYRDALREYNDWTSDGNDYEYAQYWNVYERDLLKTPITPALLLLSSDDEEEDEEDDCDEEEDEEEAYQASTPGATCRGPNCGYHSPDAYADKRDGTFVCYQCKLLGQVFGREIK